MRFQFAYIVLWIDICNFVSDSPNLNASVAVGPESYILLSRLQICVFFSYLNIEYIAVN